MKLNISLTRRLPASLRGMRVAARPAAAIMSACEPRQLWLGCELGYADERDDGSKTLAGCRQM